jgi:manganese efflux pump family protein
MIAVILLGIALGLDSFRASLAMGAAGLGGARAVRVALAFGVCDGVAPLIGLALGRATAVYVASWTEWVAPALLIGSGAYVLFKRLEDEQGPPEGGWAILGMPLCLSLDNLVAGVGLGALGPPVVPSAVVIGALSGGMSLLGLGLGRLGRLSLPARVERLSGLLLVAMGVVAAFD